MAENARSADDRAGSAEALTAQGAATLPGLLGIAITAVVPGHIEARLPVRPELMAPNGYLHAASIVALADTACGYGVLATLPPGSTGFTTIELKSNFFGTVREGIIACDASMLHGGRTTQVWDACVTDRMSGKTVAVFRCTQLLLYGKHDLNITATDDHPPASADEEQVG